MKVCVIGGRWFRYKDWLHGALNLINDQIGEITLIIESGSMGAACRAHDWAQGKEVDVVSCPLKWEKLGSAAPAEQHTRMANMKPDIVLVCPHGTDEESKQCELVMKAHGLRMIYLEKMPVPKGVEETILPSGPAPTVIVDVAPIACG